MDEGGDVVARGTIISSADASLEVFGVLLGDDNFSVSVDVVLVGHVVLPIQYRDSPIAVKDVLGQHVPWPKVFVLVDERKVTIINFICYFILLVVYFCLHHSIDFFVF